MKQNDSEPFDLEKRAKSFVYAWKGIKLLFGEHNAWIHAAATVLVLSTAWLLNITRMEWIAIVLCIGMVLAAETVNTSIEKLANFVSADWKKEIGQVKDLAAGAVLICAITAVVVALIIFIPYIV